MQREDFSSPEKLIFTTVFGSNAAATDIIRPEEHECDADKVDLLQV